jgi:hypothetical protein
MFYIDSKSKNFYNILPLSYIMSNIFCIFKFSDNDRSSLNCASMLKGGWWWKSCGRGLNGLYMDDPNDLTARQGNEECLIFGFS